jgi:alkylation response protein AidB-like acyl-CoA dehydrogenase
MDFKLTEEQQMLKDTVRQFAENELKPKAEHYDRSHEFPMEHVKKIGEMGVMGSCTRKNTMARAWTM